MIASQDSVMGGVAEFERAMMLERQREGIAKAEAAGAYKGRLPRLEVDRVRALQAEGLGASAIAAQLGVGRASIYRLTKPEKALADGA